MIKEAIVDSGVWIASKTEGEEGDKARIILETFSNGEINTIYITNYILLETVNFLLRKKHFKIALGVYDYLTKTDRIKLIHIDESMSMIIRDLFEKYESLSITDCSMVALAEDFGIKTVFSFDSDLDRVKKIIRKDSV